MASFYAELEIRGRTYAVTLWQYGSEQPTGERDKERYDLLQLVFSVPDDAQLLD